MTHEQRRRVFGDPQSIIPTPAVPKVRYTRRRREQLLAEGKVPGADLRPAVAYNWPAAHRDEPTPTVDPSDTQELIVRMRKAGVRDPLAGNMLRKLARQVAIGMSRRDFEERAALILATEWAWPNERRPHLRAGTS